MRTAPAAVAAAPPSLADTLFSRTRKAVIATLFTQPDVTLHLRELARNAGVTPTMMAKELASLVHAGLVLERRDGNRRVFTANAANPIHAELAGIARKTTGLADVLRDALARVAGIDRAFVFGSMARGTARSDSDVDLLVIGRCNPAELLTACATAGQRLGRPVNPVIYAPDEWAALRAEGRNPFMTQLRQQPRIPVIGADDDLAAASEEPVRHRAAGSASGRSGRGSTTPRPRA